MKVRTQLLNVCRLQGEAYYDQIRRNLVRNLFTLEQEIAYYYSLLEHSGLEVLIGDKGLSPAELHACCFSDDPMLSAPP